MDQDDTCDIANKDDERSVGANRSSRFTIHGECARATVFYAFRLDEKVKFALICHLYSCHSRCNYDYYPSQRRNADEVFY